MSKKKSVKRGKSSKKTTKRAKILESEHAGFWKRTLAFTVDLLIIIVFLLIISTIGKNYFITMGENLWYLALLFGGIYFMLGDSFLGKGQTIGKKLFNIRLVKKDGKFLSTRNAFGRYLVISIIIFQTGFSKTFSTDIISYMIADTFFQLVSIFLLISNVSLLIFNRDKRGFIDYISNSLVVKSKKSEDVKVPKLDTFLEGFHHHHIAFTVTSFIVTFCVVGLLVISLHTMYYVESNNLDDLFENMEKDLDLENLGMQRYELIVNKDVKKSLFISSYLTPEEFLDIAHKEEKALEILSYIANSDAILNDFDSVTIQYRTGYDMVLVSNKVQEHTTYNLNKRE